MGRRQERRATVRGPARAVITFAPLLVTTGCYLLTAWGFWREGNVGLAIAFAGYAFANFGFLWICVKGQP
jgi:hypothetical protein